MLYYEENDNISRKAGFIAGGGYILLWILLMFLLKFHFVQNDTGDGILINFGDVESASGFADPDINPTTADLNREQQRVPELPDQLLTQDFEEAPEVRQPDPKPQERPVEADRNRNDNQQTTTPAERPREVNQNALFPGRTQNSNSTSEGSAETGHGNQGDRDGSPEGSHDGTGSGAGGAGFSLAGRSVVGSLAQPVYGANKQGRVIVDITVNPAGEVVAASYRANGSSTNDTALVNAAIAAAKKSRFNKIDTEGLQTGTITYNFKLK